MGKAPGNDSIPPEIFKYGGQNWTKKLHSLLYPFGYLERFSKIPIMPLSYKNNGLRKVCDHRGFSLLSAKF